VSVRKAKRAHNLLSEHGRGGGVSPLAMHIGACVGWLEAIVTPNEGIRRSAREKNLFRCLSNAYACSAWQRWLESYAVSRA
jgi:hypothetical protein